MSDKFDGFSVNLIEEDSGEWLAHFIALPNVSAFGDTQRKRSHELETAWEAMKASYEKTWRRNPDLSTRKEYSGQFNVRIDKRIHRALAIEAARAGISLNALVAQKLALQADNWREAA